MRRTFIIATMALLVSGLMLASGLIATWVSATEEHSTGTGVPVPTPIGGKFRASLSGGEEVPPVATGGHGSASFLVVSPTELEFELSVFNTPEVTQAHIHCGARRVNGPVVAFLYDGPVVSPNGLLNQGTLTATDVITRSPGVGCPSGVADFAGLIAIIESGDAYVNVHTEANPGGEIRGQIVPNSSSFP